MNEPTPEEKRDPNAIAFYDLMALSRQPPPEATAHHDGPSKTQGAVMLRARHQRRGSRIVAVELYCGAQGKKIDCGAATHSFPVSAHANGLIIPVSGMALFGDEDSSLQHPTTTGAKRTNSAATFKALILRPRDDVTYGNRNGITTRPMIMPPTLGDVPRRAVSPGESVAPSDVGFETFGTALSKSSRPVKPNTANPAS
jgi:hypothetical protein